MYVCTAVCVYTLPGYTINEQPFFKKYVKTKYDCPNASLVHQNGFYMPNRPDLTLDEIELMVNLLKKVII